MAQPRTVIRTTKVISPRWYSGNLFFLILFLIIWFPLGVLLLIKNGSISKENSRFYLKYHGSWNWLFFWVIVFFPIAVILLLIKGVDIIEEETFIEEEITTIQR